MQLNRLGITILLVSTTLFSADVPMTTNVDASITFRLGSNSTIVDFVAGVEKLAPLSWLTSTSVVTIEAVSKHTMYQDTTYSQSIEVVTSSTQAWSASAVYNGGDKVFYNGKEYQASYWTQNNVPSSGGPWKVISGTDPTKYSVTLPRVPYSIDTAYIPVKGNKDFTLTAYPLSMIEGGVPTAPLVFNLTANSIDTVKVPVRTTLTSPVEVVNRVPQRDVVMSRVGGAIQLSVAQSYVGGSLKVLSMAGRQVSFMDFTSPTKNSLSAWDVAPGMYVLQIISKTGVASAQKFQHVGGDLRIATSFHQPQSVQRSAVLVEGKARAAMAQYRFELNVTDTKFNDTIATFDFSSGLQTPQEYYFINPNSMASVFGQVMDSALYEEFFPNRYGLGVSSNIPANGDYDFYTYNAFIGAVDNLSNIKVEVYERDGHPYMNRYVRTEKSSGATHTFTNNEGYYDFTNTERLKWTVDFADFCMAGDMETRRQELAAFLGNISHETTGNDPALGDANTCGLFWREEVSWQQSGTGSTYINANSVMYPPTSGQSYHGRGPIQISWNMNYGQLSEFLYANKHILLDKPGLLVPDYPEDGTVNFMSAIWFWMTPQAPKPSCHDVMVGNWVPSADDMSKNRDDSKMGMTINIINGGIECGSGSSNASVLDRINFYKRYILRLGSQPETDCDCDNMSYY